MRCCMVWEKTEDRRSKALKRDNIRIPSKEELFWGIVISIRVISAIRLFAEGWPCRRTATKGLAGYIALSLGASSPSQRIREELG
jgi:hypothetical protein